MKHDPASHPQNQITPRKRDIASALVVGHQNDMTASTTTITRPSVLRIWLLADNTDEQTFLHHGHMFVIETLEISDRLSCVPPFVELLCTAKACAIGKPCWHGLPSARAPSPTKLYATSSTSSSSTSTGGGTHPGVGMQLGANVPQPQSPGNIV